ncbi:MAG: TolC family protein, partial [Pyrinomonadaceae bacterium]|nr:TolC family protein [Pyrinomonadaceae bacterium]
DPTGLTIERLVSTGFERRADLLAARQRLAIAEGRLIQAGLRPNPTLETEYGSTRFLGGSAESELDVGVSQVFETAGKRRKRVEVARTELEQARAEVLALERRFAAEVRASYARAVAAGRQLDALERLIAANEELVRVTNARLKEGDVAPLELNLVRVETDRLRAQVIRTRADIEGEIISLGALVGFETTEPLRIAPLPDRPPRLDISVADLTEIALLERADLRAARLGEQLGGARIRLAQSQATPNIAGSVRYTRERRITDFPESLGGGNVGQTDNVLRFGVAVELPVFNKNQGEIASAVGEREQAVRQREFLEAIIKRDVALAYRRYRAAAEAFVLYATQIVPRSEENVRSVRAAYNLGEFSVFDVVNEQRRLIESETGYNEALRDYYSALAELEAALGTPIPNTGFAAPSVSVLPDLDSINSVNSLRSAVSGSPSPSSLAPAPVATPLRTIAPIPKSAAASQPISRTQP